MTAELALATRALSKSYGSRRALDGLDLTVPAGVVYGFLGPNGAGKTTTMRLLTGLLRPDSGTIEMLGRPFSRSDRRRLFDVGALVESPSFYPYLSGRENLDPLHTALVAADVLFEPTTTVAELESVIDRIEARIREVVPGAKCYIEAEGLKAPLHSAALPAQVRGGR